MVSRVSNLLGLSLITLFSTVISQDTSVCNVRLVNEVINTPSISLVNQTGNTIFIDSLATFGVSDYIAVPCSTFFRVTDAKGGQITSMTITTDPSTAHYTFVVIYNPQQDSIIVNSLLDRDTLLDDAKDGSTIDIALIRVVNSNTYSASINFNGVTSECFNCSHPNLAIIPSGGSSSSTVNDYMYQDTTWDFEYMFVSADNIIQSTVYTVSPVEHSVHTIFIHNLVTNDTSSLITFTTDVEGGNAYLPVLYAFLILVGLGIVHKLGRWLAIKVSTTTDIGDKIYAVVQKNSKQTAVDVNLLSFFGYDKAVAKAVAEQKSSSTGSSTKQSINDDDNSTNTNLSERLLAAVDPTVTLASGTVDTPKPVPSTKPRSSGRIRAIDTYRGISLCIMVFVNYGGGNYTRFFDHSRWNGLTVADLVFPWFVWTQGVSMAISFASERKKGATSWDLAQKTIIRSMKLYAIGLFLNGGAQIDTWRVIGVLQYFAVSYLVIGLLEAFLSPHALSSNTSEKKSTEESYPTTWKDAFWIDIGRYWVQWLVMGILGMIYMLVQSYLPLPNNCPTGYLGAGGLADQGLYYGQNCTGGAHRVIDVDMFSVHHIYHHEDSNGVVHSSATCDDTFLCDVHDPEGALGWISASWMVWLGLQAGRVITTYRHLGSGPAGIKGTVKPYLTRWLLWGVVISLIGGSLCGFTKNTGPIPINKNLWSPSFVFVLAGWGFLKLSFHYICVDILRLWSGAPFRYVGTNSIIVYATSEVFQGYAPLSWHYTENWTNHSEALVSNIVGVMTMICLARYLYLRGIFVNV